MILAATGLSEIPVPPGDRLESLKGNPEGQHCIRINGQWRVCFKGREGNAYHVQIPDYHN
jgi:proteic killer suppression protein